MELTTNDVILNKIEAEFNKSFKDNAFIKNLPALRRTSEVATVGDLYYQRTDLLSLKLYGTPAYSKIILLLNGLQSMLDFNPDAMNNSCIVPDITTVRRIIKW